MPGGGAEGGGAWAFPRGCDAYPASVHSLRTGCKVSRRGEGRGQRSERGKGKEIGSKRGRGLGGGALCRGLVTGEGGRAAVDSFQDCLVTREWRRLARPRRVGGGWRRERTIPLRSLLAVHSVHRPVASNVMTVGADCIASNACIDVIACNAATASARGSWPHLPSSPRWPVLRRRYWCNGDGPALHQRSRSEMVFV